MIAQHIGATLAVVQLDSFSSNRLCTSLQSVHKYHKHVGFYQGNYDMCKVLLSGNFYRASSITF